MRCSDAYRRRDGAELQERVEEFAETGSTANTDRKKRFEQAIKLCADRVNRQIYSNALHGELHGGLLRGMHETSFDDATGCLIFLFPDVPAARNRRHEIESILNSRLKRVPANATFHGIRPLRRFAKSVTVVGRELTRSVGLVENGLAFLIQMDAVSAAATPPKQDKVSKKEVVHVAPAPKASGGTSAKPTMPRGADESKCPTCSAPCKLEASPFSQYVSIYRCPQDHVGVQCGSCHEGLMQHVEDLDATVHTKCARCGWQSTGIPKDWWYRTVEKSQQTARIPERTAAGSARARQSSPTSCAFCGNNLTVISDGPVGKLFNGIVCKSCGAVACMSCQGSSPSKPCRECGGSVAPAYADELMKAAARFSSQTVKPAVAVAPSPAPGAAGGPLFKPATPSPSGGGSSTPGGAVVLTTEQLNRIKGSTGVAAAAKDVVVAQPKQTWTAEYGTDAYREALKHEFVTEEQRATVVKIHLQQKCDFKVRGIASCHECGAPISFEAKAYFGMGGGAGDPWCSSCKAQISVSCEQAGRDSDEVYLCAKPWTSRSGASVRSIAVEIRDITPWVREDA